MLGLLEQVADTAGAYAHVHLHEVRAGNGQERHVGLAGHGLGQQRFARARRAHQQHALGDMSAQFGVALRVAKELDDLLQFLLLLVRAGHVLERDLFAIGGDVLDAGLAEAGHFVVDRAARAAVHAGHDVHQQYERQEGQHVGQQRLQPVGGAAGLAVVALEDARVHLLGDEAAEVIVERIVAIQLAGEHRAVLKLAGEAGVADGQGLDLLLRQVLAELTVWDVAGAGGVAHGIADQHHRQQNKEE